MICVKIYLPLNAFQHAAILLKFCDIRKELFRLQVLSILVSNLRAGICQ